jgi:hypothetical protein
MTPTRHTKKSKEALEIDLDSGYDEVGGPDD